MSSVLGIEGTERLALGNHSIEQLSIECKGRLALDDHSIGQLSIEGTGRLTLDDHSIGQLGLEGRVGSSAPGIEGTGMFALSELSEQLGIEGSRGLALSELSTTNSGALKVQIGLGRHAPSLPASPSAP